MEVVVFALAEELPDVGVAKGCESCDFEFEKMVLIGAGDC